MSAPVFKHGAAPISSYGIVASWRAECPSGRPGISPWPPVMVIHSCSTSEDGVFVPAADVSIYGRGSLLKLRDAIDQALALPDEVLP